MLATCQVTTPGIYISHVSKKSTGIFSPARPQRAVGGIEQGPGQAGPPREVFLECWEAPPPTEQLARARGRNGRAWKRTPGGRGLVSIGRVPPTCATLAVGRGPLWLSGLGPQCRQHSLEREWLPSRGVPAWGRPGFPCWAGGCARTKRPVSALRCCYALPPTCWMQGGLRTPPPPGAPVGEAVCTSWVSLWAEWCCHLLLGRRQSPCPIQPARHETGLPSPSPISVTLCSSPVTPKLAKSRDNQLLPRLGQKPGFSRECGTAPAPCGRGRPGRRHPLWALLLGSRARMWPGRLHSGCH